MTDEDIMPSPLRCHRSDFIKFFSFEYLNVEMYSPHSIQRTGHRWRTRIFLVWHSHDHYCHNPKSKLGHSSRLTFCCRNTCGYRHVTGAKMEFEGKQHEAVLAPKHRSHTLLG